MSARTRGRPDSPRVDLAEVLAYYTHEVENGQDLSLTNAEARVVLEELKRLRRLRARALPSFRARGG